MSHTPDEEKRRIIPISRVKTPTFLFFLLFVPYILLAHNPRLDKPPKLILQLVLGALGSETVDLHWEALDPNGLPRLYSRGVVCHDARYAYLLGNAPAGLATLATGANPNRHGVVDYAWYSHVTYRSERFGEDDFVHTIGSNQASGASYSPRKLLVSSLSDSWRQRYPKARLYSIAYDPVDAILLGGRSLDAALWFEPKSGRWVTSSYYADALPTWVQQFNEKNLAPTYNAATWELPNVTAPAGRLARRPTSEKPDTALRGELPIPGSGYARLPYTPSGNSLLRDLIIAAVEYDGVGRGNTPDCLSVYFTPFERIAEIYGQESAQFRDALVRFDKELANLLEYLDYTVGRKEYLVVLTSAYAPAPSPWVLSQGGIPAGYFNPDKANYMLSSYLSALYGVKDVVVGYAGQSFYLNEALLEKSHLPLQQVEQTAAKFLQDFAGVASVYPMHVAQWSGGANPRLRRALEGFHPKRSGHLLIDLLPGWVVQSDRSPKARNAHYSYENHIPLVFYGWKLESRKIASPVYLHDIAETLVRLLYIRSPNASEGNPIPGVSDWNDLPKRP